MSKLEEQTKQNKDEAISSWNLLRVTTPRMGGKRMVATEEALHPKTSIYRSIYLKMLPSSPNSALDSTSLASASSGCHRRRCHGSSSFRGSNRGLSLLSWSWSLRTSARPDPAALVVRFFSDSVSCCRQSTLAL